MNSKVTVVTENEDFEGGFRNAVMDLILPHLEENGMVRGWLERENIGPRGGTSSRLYAVIEIDGIMVPIAINIYSDMVIENEVKKLIGKEQRSDRIRTALEKGARQIETSATEEPRTGFSRSELNTFNMASLTMMLERANVPLTGSERKDELVELAYQENL